MFWFALCTTLAWGTADLFYKKGNDSGERYSHLKTTVAVGVAMGIYALVTILVKGVEYDFINMLIYLPVSAMYILSMAVGYFGLKYLELSVSSPIQNASGALVCIMCLVFLKEAMDIPTAIAVALICAGVFLLGLFERREIKIAPEEKKYKIGFAAFLMPIIYCVLDSLGTFFDAYYLDDFETTPLAGVTEETLEDVANISYQFTFLAVAAVIVIFLLIRKEPLFRKKTSGSRALAALFEAVGQGTYVYAMSGDGAVAAPMIASYCVVSVVLSRIFLKEKLSLQKYLSVALVIAGIVILGILDV